MHGCGAFGRRGRERRQRSFNRGTALDPPAAAIVGPSWMRWLAAGQRHSVGGLAAACLRPAARNYRGWRPSRASPLTSSCRPPASPPPRAAPSPPCAASPRTPCPRPTPPSRPPWAPARARVAAKRAAVAAAAASASTQLMHAAPARANPLRRRRPHTQPRGPPRRNSASGSAHTFPPPPTATPTSRTRDGNAPSAAWRFPMRGPAW